MNTEQLAFKIAEHKRHLPGTGFAAFDFSDSHVLDGYNEHSWSGNHSGISHKETEIVLQVWAQFFPLFTRDDFTGIRTSVPGLEPYGVGVKQFYRRRIVTLVYGFLEIKEPAFNIFLPDNLARWFLMFAHAPTLIHFQTFRQVLSLTFSAGLAWGFWLDRRDGSKL